MPRMVFIGGTGRSGTTILKRSLSGYPHIFIPNAELRLNTDPGGLLDLYNNLTSDWDPFRADAALRKFIDLMVRAKGTNFDKIIKHIGYKFGVSLNNYSHLHRSWYSVCRSELEKLFIDKLNVRVSNSLWIGSERFSRGKFYEISHINNEQFSSFASEYLTKIICKSSNYEFLVDDSPSSILHALKLREIYPDCVFIHVYRQPVKVAESYRRQPWGGDDLSVIISRLSSVYSKLDTIETLLENDPFFISVSLERLIAEPSYRIAFSNRLREVLSLDADFDLATLTPQFDFTAKNLKKNEIKFIESEFAKINISFLNEH